VCDVVAPHEGLVGPLAVDKRLSAVSSVLYVAAFPA
jgi:hypothetical protein